MHGLGMRPRQRQPGKCLPCSPNLAIWSRHNEEHGKASRDWLCTSHDESADRKKQQSCLRVLQRRARCTGLKEGELHSIVPA